MPITTASVPADGRSSTFAATPLGMDKHDHAIVCAPKQVGPDGQSRNRLPMARRATLAVVVPKTLLDPDWRDRTPAWQIPAMLAKIPQSDYLSEVRAFETHHIHNQTLSEDWGRSWREWCYSRFKRPDPVCAFCNKKTDGERVVKVNPATADSPPEFRWFCNTACQGNFETNQPRKRPRLFG